MFENPYTQTLQDQIGQLSKLLGGQTATGTVPEIQAANKFDYVSGIEGARAYLQKMLAGTKHIVWDSEAPKFFVLQKDSNGNPARIQIGDFTLSMEPTMEEKYVSKEDFNKLVSRLDNLLAQKEVTDNG